MRRRPVTRRLTSAAALASVSLALLTGCTGSSGTSNRRQATTPSTSTPTYALSDQQAANIERGLASSDPASVLAPAVRAAVRAKPVRLLPAGSTLNIDPSTVKVAGDTATVRGTVTRAGAAAQRWDILMVRVEGSWRVYGTRQAS